RTPEARSGGSRIRASRISRRDRRHRSFHHPTVRGARGRGLSKRIAARMAIDRMKKITVVCPVHAAHRLNRTLYELCAVEIVNAVQTYGETGDGFRRHNVSTEECDQVLSKIALCLSLMDEF